MLANNNMKSVIMLLLTMTLPSFATGLQLNSVKQVVYLNGSDTDATMAIIDVPFVTAYAAPEWRFSAISKPFIPATDGSWKNPGDVNLASLYGINVGGTYRKNSKDFEVTIDITKANVPDGYPFTTNQVLEQVKKCVDLMYPHGLKDEGKLVIKVLKAKN